MVRARSKFAAWLALSSLLLTAAACSSGGAPRQTPSPEGGAAGAASADAAPSRARSSGDADWDGDRVGSPEQLLEGRFPGVRVMRTAQGGLSIRVRGGSSLGGNNEPLYIVDGQPIEAGAGGLMGVNPSDIQKIEVLKDIGSTARYGMRGANGVVLITTKRPR